MMKREDLAIDTSSPDVAEPAAPDEADSARRALLIRLSLVAGAVGAGALAGCGSNESPAFGADAGATPIPTPSATAIQAVTDTDVLVLMAQLEYLSAEYFARAVLGGGLPASLVAGSGTQGTVTGPRAVMFSDTVLAEQMRELAAQKVDRVTRLRAVLGSSAPARTDVNLSFEAGGAFAKFATDALALPTTRPTFPVLTDVYADQNQFLLGAFILQDPLMNAWRAATVILSSTANVEVAAGMLSAASLHAGLVRRLLYTRGGATGSNLRLSTVYLSDLRDSYAPTDDDQGVLTSLTATTANINPTDANGLVYNRLLNFTLNTFFLTGREVTAGGFFPAGINGAIRQSAAVSTT